MSATAKNTWVDMQNLDLSSSVLGTGDQPKQQRQSGGEVSRPESSSPRNGSGVDAALKRYDELIAMFAKTRESLIARLGPVLTNQNDPMPESQPLTNGNSKSDGKRSKLAADINDLDKRFDGEIFALQALIELIDL